MGVWGFSFFLFVLSSLAYAQDSPNLILITLDGVRVQEFFGNRPDPSIDPNLPNHELLPNFWNKYAHEGAVFGDISQGKAMKVSNPMVMSLPGYQSILTGRTQKCFLNYCGRVKEKTFPQELRKSLALPFHHVAMIGSWFKMSNASSSEENDYFVNDGLDQVPFREHQEINLMQKSDKPPWPFSRWDRHTWEHSMIYLKRWKPRFLYISLLDPDEWGHRKDYPRYVESIREFDQRIDELFSTLDQMGDYGENTSVLITTDHGRGVSSKTWHRHSGFVPSSRFVWAYLRNYQTRYFGERDRWDIRNHNDLRSVMEATFRN